MIRVFVSSTFRDLKGERELLLDELNQALTGVGMEGFIPDGRTAHEISIANMRECDLVIFLISPYYGTLLTSCAIKDCKAECPMKEDDLNDRISYTHCEYKVALAEKKLHQAYLVDRGDGGWDVLKELKGWKEIDWQEVRGKKFEGVSDDEMKHCFEVAKPAWKFREEAERELCPPIKGARGIIRHLSSNIAKWHYEGKINLKDFCGRRKELKDLLERMGESVEVYGVGGIGKTTLVHVALLIQRLSGRRIITIGRRQSYLTGSGYTYFREKCKDDQHRIIGDRITLDDIIDALSLPDEVRLQGEDEKIRTISDTIEEGNIILFIDDFQLGDRSVKKLVKSTRGVIISSKTKTGITRNELSLSGIDEDDRGELIDLIAWRLGRTISCDAKERINTISEGHPVSTEILVRNYDLIDFEKIETYKYGLDFSRDEHVEEFLERVVKEILSEGAFCLLRDLSVINTDLESNLDRAVIEQTYHGYAVGNLNELFVELIDADMLKRREGREGVYQFSYRHVQEAVIDDADTESHKRAVEYYGNKIESAGASHDDEVEILFHRSKLGHDEHLVREFSEMTAKVQPVHHGFRRLIDVGEELKEGFRGEDRASISIELGELYYNLSKFENAEEAYNEALEIYEKLAEENPDDYLSDVAKSYYNFGLLYNRLNRFENAEEAYNKTLEIYKNMAEKNPDDEDLPHVAGIQSNLELLYLDWGRFEDAAGACKKALGVYKELASKKPDVYQFELAAAHHNLGKLYLHLNRFEDAEVVCKKALGMWKELVDENPDAYLPNLAGAHHNLGYLYVHLRRFEDAAGAYREALGIQEELAEKTPDAYLSDVATTKGNLGELYLHLDRFGDAEDACNETLEIYKKLAEKNPDTYLPDVAMTYSNLGVIYRDLNRLTDAEKMYKAALEINRGLAEKNPDAYLPYVATTQNNFGNLYKDLNRLMDSEEAYREALKFRRNLAEKNPDTYLPDVAATQNNLGILYRELNRYKDAEAAYNEALEIYKKLAEKNIDAYQHDLSRTQKNLGILRTYSSLFG